jgi:hypothetical protein
MVTQFMFILTIPWLLSMVVGTIKIDGNKICKLVSGNFDHNPDAAVPVSLT